MKKYVSIIILLLIVIMQAICVPVYAQSEVKAKVITTNKIEEIKEENLPTKKAQNVTVRILEGEYENEEYEMSYIISEDSNSIISNLELKEDDNVLAVIEEKDGEITNVNYIETINSNYRLYIVGAILILLLIIIGINTGITSTIVYILTIVAVSLVLIFSMKLGWNLIWVSSILSFVITVAYIIKVNGISRKTFSIIFGSVISISFAGVLINILFDIMNLTNVNVKITDNFVNIKDLITSCIIVVSCGLFNAIILVKLNIDAYINKPYKTKSDNIIEGQRSLKL